MLSRLRLPGSLPDEKVVKIIRRTLFMLVKKTVLALILAGLPPFFFYLTADLLFADIINSPIGYPILILGAASYYLFVWLLFFFEFVDYYLNVWIITNKRIVSICQQGFFARTIAEQRLERIQDVTSEVKGFFPTVIGYGNLYAQTAAEKERFFLESAPSPDKIRDLLIKLTEEVRKKERRKNPIN